MTEFKSELSNYEQSVRDLHGKTGMAKALGVELTTVEPGRVDARMPLTPHVMHQHGFAHAGALATLADMVCGLAAYSLMRDGDSVMSTDIHLSLMRPGDTDWIIGRGRVIRAGKRTFFTEADLVAIDDRGERLVARVSATMVRVRESRAEGRQP